MKGVKSILTVLLVMMVIIPIWGQTQNQGAGKSDDPYILPEAASAIKVDGVIDDKEWETALKLDLPYETWPRENIPASVKSEVYLTYTKSHLYAAFKCFEPKKKNIRAFYFERDFILADDMVVLFLDTFNDERRAYGFRSNAMGVQFDDIRTRVGASLAWDAIYNTSAKIYDWGYVVEMAIPFNQLRFQKTKGGEQVWGFNARRIWPRGYLFHNDVVKMDRNNNCMICQFVKMKGFKGVTPGNNIEIIPTLTAESSDSRKPYPTGELKNQAQEVDGGLTARWGVTPNITMVGTVNPDFSQVEADTLKLDINEPFDVFYEERRPFFYEGSEYFSTNLEAVYTRMIRDPKWGLKLTGKAGENTFGAYVVRDELTNLVFPGSEASKRFSLTNANTSAVFRYKKDFGFNYSVGLLGTFREGDEYHNRLVGLDSDFNFTRKDRLQIQVLGSQTIYPNKIAKSFKQDMDEFGGSAIDVLYSHESRNWNFSLNYRNLSDGFRSDLGYIPQVDYRQYNATAKHVWLSKKQGSWYRQISLAGAYIYSDDQEGKLLKKGGSLELEYFGPLQIRTILTLSATTQSFNGKDFNLTRVSLFGLTKPKGNLEFQLYGIYGDHIDFYLARPAERLLLVPELTLKPNRHMRIKLNHTLEILSVDAGRMYTANITQGTILFHLSLRTYIRAILQYKNINSNPAAWKPIPMVKESEELNTQFLFAYELNPRTVLFLGYSDISQGTSLYEMTQKNRTFFAKISYALSL